MVHLELVTAEAVKYKGECKHVILPGVLGEMDILSSHAPLVSMLDPGVVRVFAEKGELRFVVSQGFATVAGNQVVCLVDSALEPAEVNSEKVRARLAELESELAKSPNALERNRVELNYLKSQLHLVGSA